MNQTQSIKDGLTIYDKLSETYGIQDIIKDKLKSYLRKHRSIICHNQMIDEIKELHEDFLGFYYDEYNYYDDYSTDLNLDSGLYVRYVIHLLPELYGSIRKRNRILKLRDMHPMYP